MFVLHMTLASSSDTEFDCYGATGCARCPVRGIVIYVRLSARLSVCSSVTLVDRDHNSKSWKLIARTISPATSFLVAQRPSTYSQRNMGKFLEDYRGGVGKEACWSTNATISLKRVKMEEKLIATHNQPKHSLFVAQRPSTYSQGNMGNFWGD